MGQTGLLRKEMVMGALPKVAVPPTPSTDGWAELRQQYGCGPVQFTGADDALYERHLGSAGC